MKRRRRKKKGKKERKKERRHKIWKSMERFTPSIQTL
jgi:hypothetical protein